MVKNFFGPAIGLESNLSHRHLVNSTTHEPKRPANRLNNLFIQEKMGKLNDSQIVNFFRITKLKISVIWWCRIENPKWCNLLLELENVLSWPEFVWQCRYCESPYHFLIFNLHVGFVLLYNAYEFIWIWLKAFSHKFHGTFKSRYVTIVV